MFSLYFLYGNLLRWSSDFVHQLIDLVLHICRSRSFSVQSESSLFFHIFCYYSARSSQIMNITENILGSIIIIEYSTLIDGAFEFSLPKTNLTNNNFPLWVKFSQKKQPN
jgi:hypothetical protein